MTGTARTPAAASMSTAVLRREVVMSILFFVDGTADPSRSLP
jgi:hypothetical protein